VLFQIDQNRYLATFAIGYELNASHGSILHASPWCPAFLLGLLGRCLSNLLILKQKSPAPAYNSCSRFH